MGALFLYRGNLHRVADIPRRFSMPPRAISLTKFRRLLRKRNLSITQFSSRNPSAKPNPRVDTENHVVMVKNECPAEAPSDLIPSSEPRWNDCKGVAAITEDHMALEVVDSMDHGDGKKELICKLDSTHEKEERKRDLEQKLHVLNEKKHYLVQMLKQILNAEEEIKRRSIQSGPPHSYCHTPGPEGGTPRLHEVHMPRESAPVQATSRSLMASSMVSPSRFAPTSQQSHLMSLPSVSAASGSHFGASSPSPAASGGNSSAFRDSR